MKKYLPLFALLLLLLFTCEKEVPVTIVTGGTKPGTENPGGGQTGGQTGGETGGETGSETDGETGGETGGTTENSTVPQSAADAVPYSSLHDPVSDQGQFYIPDKGLNPEVYWTMVFSGTGYGKRWETDQTDVNSGLQNFLLMESIQGLVNRACEQGKTNIGIWIEAGGKGYSDEKASLSNEIGRQTAYELATKTYNDWNGYKVTVRDLFDGYVLTDVVNNPESANVATVASHVFNSIIVDVRDKALFDAAGYTMKYDASKKKLSQAFSEFKDKCNNDCLVLMPVKCAENRAFAIKNNLFIINLNSQWGNGDKVNSALFNTVLAWLKPCSQVVGWEQGVGEDVFVSAASKYGHMSLAADWSYNMSITTHNFRQRQPSTLVKTINPRNIDYDKKSHYYSFFLTDGDNYQFIITDNFVNNYYDLSTATGTKTAFEVGTQSLIQLAPTRFEYLMGIQPSAQCTIMETFGGGYFYIDEFSTSRSSERAANLKTLATRTAAHMRQHGIKVLHVMAKDLSSSAAKEALQAFVDANDQLEGITAVQYNPYTGGDGKIIWLKNKAGYDIPCITTRYMVWNGLTTTSSVASDMKSRETSDPSFCTVCLHCWSSESGMKSTDMAYLLKKGLPSGFTAVSMQELIWRVRMQYRREQTQQYLKTIK